MQEDHPDSLLWKSSPPPKKKWLLKIIVWLIAKLMGFVFRRLDAITALAYDHVDYIKSWGKNSENDHLWGNFPEIRYDYTLSLEDYIHHDYRMINFGIIYSYSKQEVELQAFKKLPNVKC